MASTMPSATAWRARSWLVQWVMCSPSAIGSRQASSTIWARWRGGNLQRMPQVGFVQQEAFVLDLEPRQVPGPGHGLKDREVRVGDGKRARFPSRHGRNSDVATG